MTSDSKFYNHEIKTLFMLQILGCVLYLTVLLSVDASRRIITVGAYGCALMTMNSLLLMWVARNIFLKKLIALSVAVVVFKTSVFIILLYYFKANSSSESIAFMAGVAVATLSLGLVGFRKKNGSF